MSAHFDQIKSTLEHVSAVWKTNDAAAVAACFVEDGTLINPFGQRADGRAAVAAMYAEYFAGMLRGTSTVINPTTVRAIGGDYAFVDGEQTIHGPDGSVVVVAHLAALMRKGDGDRWRFVDSRPYSTAPTPAPAR